jgi:hypothetical protein
MVYISRSFIYDYIEIEILENDDLGDDAYKALYIMPITQWKKSKQD